LNKNNSLREAVNYLLILAGSFIMAAGVVGFLAPNNITTGGTAGLAIVLHHVIPLPIGVLMALVNVPLLILGLRYLGKKFAIRTVICILMTVLSVDLLAEIIRLPKLSDEPLLATLYGGVCIGVGLGLIFRGGASAGGGTILARIVSMKSNVKTSSVILMLDAAVVISAAYVFSSIELALWSMISIYTSAKLIDMILVGAQTQKIVHVSSTKNLTELSKIIHEELGISGTIVKGDDLGATEHKDIVFIMVDKSRLNALKQTVKSYDEKVKMIVMEAVEVL
jgi:uncharacterized membrane-anchored protein YitT (DUF2179 family)